MKVDDPMAGAFQRSKFNSFLGFQIFREKPANYRWVMDVDAWKVKKALERVSKNISPTYRRISKVWAKQLLDRAKTGKS